MVNLSERFLTGFEFSPIDYLGAGAAIPNLNHWETICYETLEIFLLWRPSLFFLEALEYRPVTVTTEGGKLSAVGDGPRSAGVRQNANLALS